MYIIVRNFNKREIDWTNCHLPGVDGSWRGSHLAAVQEKHLYQHITQHTRVRSTDRPAELGLVFTCSSLGRRTTYAALISKSSHVAFKIHFT